MNEKEFKMIQIGIIVKELTGNYLEIDKAYLKGFLERY